jgi:hypothetical protein
VRAQEAAQRAVDAGKQGRYAAIAGMDRQAQRWQHVRQGRAGQRREGDRTGDAGRLRLAQVTTGPRATTAPVAGSQTFM